MKSNFMKVKRMFLVLSLLVTTTMAFGQVKPIGHRAPQGFEAGKTIAPEGDWVKLDNQSANRAAAIVDDIKEGSYNPLYELPDDYAIKFYNYPYAGSYDVATQVPYSFQGFTLESVKLCLNNEHFAGKKINVWIDDIKNNEHQNSVEVTVPDNGSDCVLVTFKEPYVVPSGGTYIGYSFEMDKDEQFNLFNVFIQGDGKKIDANASSLCVNLGKGWNFYGDSYGPLAAVVKVKSRDNTQNSVMPHRFHEIFGVPGEKLDMGISFANASGHQVTDIDYKITQDGVTLKEENYKFTSPVTAKAIGYIPVSVTFPDKVGKCPFVFEISKVNGEPNTNERTTTENILNTIEKSAHRKSLAYFFESVEWDMEPLAIVACRKLKAMYGDDFIPLGLHFYDAMTSNSYSTLSQYGNPPFMAVDRRYCFLYPYGVNVVDGDYTVKFNNDKILDASLARTSEAEVKLTASFDNAEKTAISYSFTTNFLFDSDENPYTYTVYLVHDGMKGEGSGWDIYNPGEWSEADFPAEDFGDFLNIDGPITGCEFDNVVIDCTENPLVGTPIGGGDAIKKGDVRTATGTFNLEGNALIQNKEKLRLVVELKNTHNGSLVNADMAVPSAATGISSAAVSDSEADNAIYNLQGLRVNGLRKGINIIGKKKIIVR